MIITGPLGALKTTLARQLSDALGMPLLCKDDIKASLFDKAKGKKDSKALSQATFLNMLKQLPSLSSVILEANFKQNEYDQLIALLQELDRPRITLYLSAEAKVLYQRYTKRQKNRHPAHLAYQTMSFKHFQQSIDEHTLNVFNENVLYIDTTTFTPQDFNLLQKKLRMA